MRTHTLPKGKWARHKRLQRLAGFRREIIAQFKEAALEYKKVTQVIAR